MLRVKDVSFSYGTKRRIYNNLSFSLDKGGVIGLLGRNGEGKTTLMKLITGQLVSQRGRVLTLGIDAGSRKFELLQQVYMLPEEFVVPRISIQEYFDIITPFYPSYDASIADEIFRAFELDWSWNLSKISLGQRKKTMITLALSLRTPILLLDEPTNGLDIPSKSIFRRLLAKYSSEEQLIIISTHQVRDLEQIIDHILILKNNQIVCNESISSLSRLFSFGQVLPTNKPLVLYCEPSITGEYGMWEHREGQDSVEDFSIELFFNAIIAQSDAIEAVLRKIK